jgi:hypothetical protein
MSGKRIKAWRRTHRLAMGLFDEEMRVSEGFIERVPENAVGAYFGANPGRLLVFAVFEDGTQGMVPNMGALLHAVEVSGDRPLMNIDTVLEISRILCETYSRLESTVDLADEIAEEAGIDADNEAEGDELLKVVARIEAV